MTYEFSDFLENNQQRLLAYFAASKVSIETILVPDAWPPELLDEDGLARLHHLLDECIPLDSMLVDLWDWDIHFEGELASDWYYSTVFGDEQAVESCATELADYFLEVVDERGIDYNQQEDPSSFDQLVREEAIKFVLKWRENIRNRLLPSVSA